MAISIYPPTLKSTQIAFSAVTASYPIYFTLPTLSAFSEIGHIQIRVVQQTNNKSVVNTSKYPDGIIYKPANQILSSNLEYYVNIVQSEDLVEPWLPGCLYKIQVRFGTTPMYASVEEFANWKKEQINNGTFSEWSTVMIIKALTDPTVQITNMERVLQDIITSQRTENTTTPLIYGNVIMPEENKELIEEYKFDLYDAEEDVLLESSGWLQNNAFSQAVNTHRFNMVLTQYHEYYVIYTIKTINGYVKSSIPYTFTPIVTFLEGLENAELRVDNQSAYCQENACISLYCTNPDIMTGNFVISRSSEKSNFTVYEELHYFTCHNEVLEDRLIFTDFTVESGIKYKYAIQQENKAGLRTAPVYSPGNQAYSIDFEHLYLYRDGVQLRLTFNPQIQSFKHTVLQSKQDTLGSKYPFLSRNGNAYYAEFQIRGLISFHMDENRTFFEQREDGYYYKDKLVIPQDKFEHDDLRLDTNLTANNTFVEKVFRDKVEEFLNDFSYKLFKSSTEGNMIVGLMNVNMTPNQRLGRMIYDFSATAYEVLDNTIENLNSIGVINVGSFQSLATDEVTLSFGQVNGVYTNGNSVNIYDLIRRQEEVPTGHGYRYSLKKVSQIWIESYPDIDFNVERLELQGLISNSDNTEEIAELENQLAEYEELEKALEYASSTSVMLEVNGTKVMIKPNKVYSVEEGINSLNLVSSMFPLLINYVCQLTIVEDESVGIVRAIDSSRIWNQISGIFTGTHDVLMEYNAKYRNSQTYRIYNPNPDALIQYDKSGQVLVDNTTFSLYKDINIFNIIEQDARHQVELIYNVNFKPTKDEWVNSDGTIFYRFARLIEFDIEADEGTYLYIGSDPTGANAERVRIGPTGRYVLRNIDENDSDIKYIALESPRYCVINYMAITDQTRKEKG